MHFTLAAAERRRTVSVAMWAWLAMTPMYLVVHANPRLDPPATKRVVRHWAGVYDVTGRCQYGVPSTWKFDGASGHAVSQAPDGSVTVEQDWLPAGSWASYTMAIRRKLNPGVVQEDTPWRLAFEYSPGWPGVHLFVAVPAPAGVCETKIDISPRAEASMKGIIDQVIREIVAREKNQ